MNDQTKPTESKSITTEIEGKDIAIISYLTIIGLVIAYFMNKEKQHDFAAFHIRQAAGLAAIGLVFYLIGKIFPLLGFLINIVAFIPLIIIVVIGLMNALNGKRKGVPLFGDFFDKTFQNLA